jgi:choline dehydrogenase-like flavoprotein
MFRARYYVVAAGGIENARLLLNSTGVQSEGLGNGNNLVGRFFSDHVAIEAGLIGVADRGANLELYERQPYGNVSEVVVYKDITFEAQAREGLTSGNVRLTRMGSETAGLTSLRQLVRGRSDDLGQHIRNVVTDLGGVADVVGDYLWYGRPPLDRLAVQFNLDAAPNPDSRVTLGDEVDPLGLRRVRLDWQLSEIDERTFRWMAQQLATVVAASDFGRLRLDFDPEDIRSAVGWHYHNISTTRMASDPADGVVDADCRVHGIDNLYMGGSSVFATCGGGSPTLMIVALAIRLGDHLKTRGLT